MQNQLIVIQGTCDHNCPKNLNRNKQDLQGYVLGGMPCCDGDLIGTTVLSNHFARFHNFMVDIFHWLKFCIGLDVLIINFDSMPTKFEPRLSFKNAYCAVLVRGTHIRFINSVKEMRDLYERYATTYECRDYPIENTISSLGEGFCFRFDRPKTRRTKKDE